MTKPEQPKVEAVIASGNDTVTAVVSDYKVSSKEETVQAATSTIVLTIGHSTRTIEEFINLLLAHRVSRVVDVRTIPRSRHNPQFNADSLPGSLKKVGVGYVHMAGLGGLRHPMRDSLNLVSILGGDPLRSWSSRAEWGHAQAHELCIGKFSSCFFGGVVKRNTLRRKADMFGDFADQDL